MKRAVTCLGAAALLAGCGADPDPWQAAALSAADAPLGAQTQVAGFDAEVDENCMAGPVPVIEIVQQGALGTASVGASSRTITDEGGACDGSTVPQAALFYEGASAGIDTVLVREMRGGARPDVLHATKIRVR